MPYIISHKNHLNYGFVKGDMEAMFMVHDDRKAFEVEFTTLAADPLGVMTLAEDEIRPVSARGVPHVRAA